MSYPRPTLYGTLYRWLMKLSHRFNWHHTKTYYPEGDTMVRCEWCGLAAVMKRRGYKPAISTDQQFAANQSNSTKEK